MLTFFLSVPSPFLCSGFVLTLHGYFPKTLAFASDKPPTKRTPEPECPSTHPHFVLRASCTLTFQNVFRCSQLCGFTVSETISPGDFAQTRPDRLRSRRRSGGRLLQVPLSRIVPVPPVHVAIGADQTRKARMKKRLRQPRGSSAHVAEDNARVSQRTSRARLIG